MKLYKVLIFQHSLYLKIVFLSSETQVMKLTCYVKEEVARNWKSNEVSTPITDTIITLGKLGLSFYGHRNDSKYHIELVVYTSGGFGSFVEFLQFLQLNRGRVDNQDTSVKVASFRKLVT